MGRKPNTVVSAHFTRGTKISDASNRYHWTCKQCGEGFPKGRTEGLYNHITKRCTALTLEEKSALVLKIHEFGLAASLAGGIKNKENLEKRKEAQSPFLKARRQSFNGLNVLAEASRQVVARQHSYSPVLTPEDDMGGTSMVLDPALENEGNPSTFFYVVEGDGSSREDGTSPPGTANGASMSSPLKLIRNTPVSSTTIAPRIPVPLPLATSGTQASSLTSIAASANASLAQTMAPQLSNSLQQNRHVSNGLSVAPQMANQQTPSWIRVIPTVIMTREVVHDRELPKQKTRATFPRPIAITPHHRNDIVAMGSSRKSSIQKVKGRATYSQAKKEHVKKMREIGSCIRCKILRKPCSETNPCVTCGAIDSARTWKGFPCLRAKLVDMYQGYMLGLGQALSSNDINSVKSKMRFVHGPIKLFVKYLEDADALVLGGLEGQAMSPAIDPSLSTLSNGHGVSMKTIILDSEANNLPKVFEEYIKKEAAHFSERETSPIIKSVAMLVHQFSQESEDVLVRNVLDLWVLTTMVSSPMSRWKISALRNPQQSSSSVGYGRDAGSFPTNLQIDQQSHTLIYSQLQCGLEKIATKLSTHAMNKLERRLMRPVLIDQFEVFLMAILLINCIERHSWIFYSWMDESKAAQWPLDQSPADLIPQAEQVMNVLAFMTKIRNLIPRITASTAGGILKADYPKNDKYAKWFEQIGVTVDFLNQRQDAVFDASRCCSLDLKYSATLLFPTQNAGYP